MTLLKPMVVAGIAGLVTSGIGIGMVALGGWGPCGPASTLSTVGGWLTIEHALWLSRLVPGIESAVARMHADFPFLLIWPALLWSAVAFGALTFWQRVRQHEP
jgi:hypothetical protein